MLQTLPITDLPTQPPIKDRPVRAWTLHILRIAIFSGILLLITLQARERYQHQLEEESELNYPLDIVLDVFPTALEWGHYDADSGTKTVLNKKHQLLGYVMQTSPFANHIIGFSGPTNVLLMFNTEHQIQGVKILWCKDTLEHREQVEADSQFLKNFVGLNQSQIQQISEVDVVSGATLTSLAVVQSIIHRMGGDVPSLKFPNPLRLEETTVFFEEANRIQQDEQHPAMWHVFDAVDSKLGSVLRTSPAADSTIGYQGPTESLLALDESGLVIKLRVRESFDNLPYYGYLNQDYSFRDLYTGFTLDEVAAYDLEANNVEGVSGATMTSLAVAEGVKVAAIQATKQHEETTEQSVSRYNLSARDFGTLVVIIAGCILGLSRCRGNFWLRICFQSVLIVYVGFINGDLISQAMLVGWTQNGVPLSRAISLVIMTGVAFIFPVFSKQNIYCSHLCPHGAIQQLARNRVRKKLKLSKRLRSLLKLIPAVLLLWVLIVAMLHLPYSLVDIEPFDAYLFRIAGWSTICIFILGLVAAFYVPMAYCKYGCPTGNLLEYLRRHRRSDILTLKDAFAVGLLLLAGYFYWST